MNKSSIFNLYADWISGLIGYIKGCSPQTMKNFFHIDGKEDAKKGFDTFIKMAQESKTIKDLHNAFWESWKPYYYGKDRANCSWSQYSWTNEKDIKKAMRTNEWAGSEISKQIYDLLKKQ